MLSTELLCPLKATFQMPELLRPILHAMLTVSGNRVSRQWHRLSLGLSARFAEFAVPGLLCQVSCGICPLCLQGQKGGTALDRVLRECATDPLISQTMFCVSDSVFGQSSCGIRDCFARGVSRVRASCTVPRFGFTSLVSHNESLNDSLNSWSTHKCTFDTHDNRSTAARDSHETQPAASDRRIRRRSELARAPPRRTPARPPPPN